MPLHLRGTSFDTEPQIAGRHSHGYVRIGKHLTDVTVASPSSAWAAGAIVSTADDLERFFSTRGQLHADPQASLNQVLIKALCGGRRR